MLLRLILALLSGCFIHLNAEPLRVIDDYPKDCRVLKVSGSVGWYPVLMRDAKTEKLDGISIHLIRMIADDLDLEIEFIPYPWKRSLQHLELGYLDMILGIYKTSQRAKVYQYSPAYMVNEARIFTRIDKQFKLQNLSNLIGLKGDQVLGGSFGDVFDNYAKTHLDMLSIKSLSAEVSRLKLGRSDFLISDYHDASKEIQDQASTASIDIVALPFVIARNPVYFAMSKDSSCAKLAPAIFAQLQLYIDDDSVDSIAQQKGYPFIDWRK